jgi:hypothetical protein
MAPPDCYKLERVRLILTIAAVKKEIKGLERYAALDADTLAMLTSPEILPPISQRALDLWTADRATKATALLVAWRDRAEIEKDNADIAVLKRCRERLASLRNQHDLHGIDEFAGNWLERRLERIARKRAEAEWWAKYRAEMAEIEAHTDEAFHQDGD